MRWMLLSVFIAVSLPLSAQVKIPPEIARQLGDHPDFYQYARAMTRYLQINLQQTDTGTANYRYFTSQEKKLARQLWYLENRLDGSDRFVNSSRQNFDAITEYERNRRAAPDAAALTSNGAWTIVGPLNNTPGINSVSSGIGRADRIAFHPTDPNIIYAGTPAGGIFRSDNKGLSWVNLNDYMPSLGVSGLVVSWNDPNVIYALTGDGDSNLGPNGFVESFDYIRPSIGVLKSTDGGASWNTTGDFGINGFFVGHKLVQSPVNANILLAATSYGLYRTVNGGTSWTKVSSTNRRYYDIEWKPGSSTRVYAATADSIFLSDNAGATWTAINDRLPNPLGSCTRIALAVTPINASYLYALAITADSTGFHNKGLFRTTDNALSFSQQNNSLLYLNGTPEYMLALAVAPDNVNILLQANLVISRSTNAGVSFSASNQDDDASGTNYVHADVHDVAYNPLDNLLYVACDGGVYRSADDGLTYTPCYAGFSATQFYHFDVSTADENYMLAGAQDNGIMHRPGPFVSFRKELGGDGFDTRFFNGSTTDGYAVINKTVYRCLSGFTNIDAMPLPADWYPAVALSYFNNNIAFASNGEIYRTVDGGANWVNTGANGRWALATCPGNGNRVYAAGGASFNDQGSQLAKKMFRSDNQGATWTELQNNPGFPPTITRISSIAVNPVNSSHVWVTMSGYISGQKVFYSNDAGANWQNISGSIPNLPVNAIVIGDNGDAYLGTDVGVFFKSLSMSDWVPYYNGLPRVPVTEMHIRNTTLYISTFGRGIWKSDLHGGCPATLNLSALSGPRFYEAVQISTTAQVAGGATSEIFLRAQNYIDLGIGFRADGTTGAKFRAYIGSCGGGGIPVFRPGEGGDAAVQAGAPPVEMNIENTLVHFSLQEDVKTSIALVDASDKVSDFLLLNRPLLKGDHVIRLEGKQNWKGKRLVQWLEGRVAAVSAPLN